VFDKKDKIYRTPEKNQEQEPGAESDHNPTEIVIEKRLPPKQEINTELSTDPKLTDQLIKLIKELGHARHDCVSIDMILSKVSVNAADSDVFSNSNT